MSESNNLYFREVQRFKQIYVWLPLAVSSGLMFFAMYKQLVLGEEFGNNPPPDWFLLPFGILIAIGIPLLMYSCALTIEVRSDGLFVRYFPFIWKFRQFNFSDILRYEAITYNPIKDYGGWGLKYGANGKAYNVSGKRGVKLELSSGESLLLGSQRADEMVAEIDSAIGKTQAHN